MNDLVMRLVCEWVQAERAASARLVSLDARMEGREEDADAASLEASTFRYNPITEEETGVALERVLQVMAGEVRWSECGPGDKAIWRSRLRDVDTFLKIPAGNTAVLSSDLFQSYRWVLSRSWELPRLLDAPHPYNDWHCVFCMLNPSKADANRDDPTVRKCYGFASRWGFRGLIIVNLYGWRATDPKDLAVAVGAGHDVVGMYNDQWLRYAFEYAKNTSGFVVPAWGRNKKGPVADRIRSVVAMAHEIGVDLRCIGVNDDGSPKHPLMPSYDCALVPWRAS